MKKMFGTVLLGALLASSALASSDFLARVSQGALSDKSEGVKVLSLDEMKEVKGGYRIFQTNSGRQVFTLQNIRVGSTSITKIGIVIGFNQYKHSNSVSCGFGQSVCDRNDYMSRMNFADLEGTANPRLGEFVALTATKIVSTGLFGIPKIHFSEGYSKVLVSDRDVYHMHSVYPSGMIVGEVRSKFRRELSRILVTRF